MKFQINFLFTRFLLLWPAILSSVVAYLALPHSSQAAAPVWKWAGYEIIGYKTAKRPEIEKMIPLALGSDYATDNESWEKICKNLRLHFNFYRTSCSAVRYADFKAFFVVDIVENSDATRVQFRAAPVGDIPLADASVLSLYDKLYERLFDLFSKGRPSIENHDRGYLDYKDGEMAQLAATLASEVPKFHDNLFDVLKNDRSGEKRARAANLLNWARDGVRRANSSDVGADVVKAASLLDDPSGDVRNNLSRFTMAFVDQVKGVKERHELIKAFLTQSLRPSHGDRNKALYSLLSLVKAHPTDAAYLKEKGRMAITLISEQSVLFNVRDPALELLKLMP